MSTVDITLTWTDPNLIEKGYKVYRSKSPMDINNMPDAISTLEKNTTSFVDVSQTIGDTNYYRVSAWIDGNEVLSDELQIQIKSLNIYVGMRITTSTSSVQQFNSGFQEISSAAVSQLLVRGLAIGVDGIYVVCNVPDTVIYKYTFDLKNIEWSTVISNNADTLSGIEFLPNGEILLLTYNRPSSTFRIYMTKIDPSNGDIVNQVTRIESYSPNGYAVDLSGGIYYSSASRLIKYQSDFSGYEWGPISIGYNNSVSDIITDNLGRIFLCGIHTSEGRSIKEIDPVDGSVIWTFKFLEEGVNASNNYIMLCFDMEDNIIAVDAGGYLIKINKSGTLIEYIRPHGDTVIQYISIDGNNNTYTYVNGVKSLYKLDGFSNNIISSMIVDGIGITALDVSPGKYSISRNIQ